MPHLPPSKRIKKRPQIAPVSFCKPKRINEYLFLSYLVTLVNTFGFLYQVAMTDLLTALFAIGVYLTYSLIYLAPAILLLWLTCGLARLLFKNHARLGNWLVYVVAVGGVTIVQLLIYIDKTIYRLYGMHLNGFVWNLIITRGGLDSMGSSHSATITYGIIIAGLLLVQVILLVVVLRVRPVQLTWPRLFPKRVKITLAILLMLIGLGERVTYGISHLRSYSSVLICANVFPFYLPMTFYHLAKRLGLDVERSNRFTMKQASIRLNYPLKPLVVEPPAKPVNIVWLVAESLRFDMLDPQIMPRTWAFGQKAQRFTQHYSGGNGTRMGMFSMFYGLYGNYWFSFLEERRGPVLIDVLKQQHYQMSMYTSAEFSYPEFDKTVFSNVPGNQLHEYTHGRGWQRDRVNVTDMLAFIQNRDKARPFMTFMFFESPHARYYFPDESIIRTPYLADFNYATMDLARDIQLIKNRYINACHHLDSQLARVVDFLEQQDLLKNTIVLITGDHGQEFMEKGRWGHNSQFTEEQTRVPLLLWIPGKAPSVQNRMTSHLDIPATLLPMLGIANPPQDYSLGFDLFGKTPRQYTVLSDWSHIGYVDSRYKARFPLTASSLLQNRITDKNDQPLQDTTAFYKRCRPNLLKVLTEMSTFSK